MGGIVRAREGGVGVGKDLLPFGGWNEGFGSSSGQGKLKVKSMESF